MRGLYGLKHKQRNSRSISPSDKKPSGKNSRYENKSIDDIISYFDQMIPPLLKRESFEKAMDYLREHSEQAVYFQISDNFRYFHKELIKAGFQDTRAYRNEVFSELNLRSWHYGTFFDFKEGGFEIIGGEYLENPENDFEFDDRFMNQ